MSAKTHTKIGELIECLQDIKELLAQSLKAQGRPVVIVMTHDEVQKLMKKNAGSRSTQ